MPVIHYLNVGGLLSNNFLQFEYRKMAIYKNYLNLFICLKHTGVMG